MDFKKQVIIGAVFILIINALKGAFLYQQQYFLEFLNDFLFFFLVLFFCLTSRELLVPLLRNYPAHFFIIFFVFLTFLNVMHTVAPKHFRELPKLLPDNSLYSMMEGRIYEDFLMPAFLRKEARGKTVFIHSKNSSLNKVQYNGNNVYRVQLFDEDPDVFIGNLGLNWSIYQNNRSKRGFEFVKHGDNIVIGRVGELP